MGNNKFLWDVKEEAGVVKFILSGTITEKSDFTPLLQKKATRIVIDLGGIERINSGGVGEWVTFVNKLSSPPREVILDRCSSPIVQQFNMISTMRGKARVRSVMVPYLCADCGAEHQNTLNLETSSPKSVPTVIPCTSCGGQMEFDDLPEAYFSFYEGK